MNFQNDDFVKNQNAIRTSHTYIYNRMLRVSQIWGSSNKQLPDLSIKNTFIIF